MNYSIITIVAVSVLSFLFGSVWRRCYGGWDSRIWERIFPKHGSSLHRNFWRIVSIGALFCLFFFWRGIGIWWSITGSLIGHFLTWDWTFGMYMNMGRGEYPDESEREEYKEQFFGRFLNWMFEEKKESVWNISVRYGDFYNFLGMTLRYIAPFVVLAIIPGYNTGLLINGFLIGMFYLIGILLVEKFPEKKDRFYVSGFAELMSGGLFYISLVLNGVSL